jgi:hypothetical protein
VVAAKAAPETSVIALGPSAQISESITEAFERHGISIGQEDPIRDFFSGASPGPPIQVEWTPAVTGELEVLDSLILIIGGPHVEALFDERPPRTSRKSLKEQADVACKVAVENILAMGVLRFLTICDARQLSFGERIRLVRWVRDLTRRVSYESSINGPHQVAVSYALADTDNDVRRIADAAVKWHRGDTRLRSATARVPEQLSARPAGTSNGLRRCRRHGYRNTSGSVQS